MSKSPSKPLPISSPREGSRLDNAASSLREDLPVSASPRPDIERLREQISGTPPPNIPQRHFAPPVSSSPFRQSLGGPSGVSLSGTPRSFGPSPRASRPSTPRPNAGGISGFDQIEGPESRGSPAGTPGRNLQHLDDLPAEEKARVLRRHLVSREERAKQDEEGESEGSQTAPPGATGATTPGSTSGPGPGTLHREDTEPFPIPFNAVGGDIT